MRIEINMSKEEVLEKEVEKEVVKNDKNQRILIRY